MSELLWERGYAATSPRDVLARAEVGQGSMYHYFSGKHELAVEAIGRLAGQYVAGAATLAGPGSPVERIRRYLAAPRDGLRGCRIGRLTQDPEVFGDDEMSAAVAGAFDTALAAWRSTLSEAIDAGELPAETDPTRLAMTLMSVLQGGYVLARAYRSQDAMTQAIDGAIGLIDSLARSAAERPGAGNPEAPVPADAPAARGARATDSERKELR